MPSKNNNRKQSLTQSTPKDTQEASAMDNEASQKKSPHASPSPLMTSVAAPATTMPIVTTPPTTHTAMPITPTSATPASPTSQKLIAELTKYTLAHLYSPNAAYQDRALDSYYHPTLASYSDPLLSVKSVDRIRQLFHFYFTWFVEASEVEVHHMTFGPPSSLMVYQKDETKESPQQLQQQQHDPVHAIRRSGHVVVADYTLRVLEYTRLGSLLSWFGLLPPLVLFSYAPRCAEGMVSAINVHKGLRILSKFHWIDEPHAVQGGRLCILAQEDLYSVGSIVNYFLSLPLLLLAQVWRWLGSMVGLFLKWIPKPVQQRMPWVQGVTGSGGKLKSPEQEEMDDTARALKSEFTTADAYLKEPLGWAVTQGSQLVQEVPRLLSLHLSEHNNALRGRFRERRNTSGGR